MMEGSAPTKSDLQRNAEKALELKQSAQAANRGGQGTAPGGVDDVLLPAPKVRKRYGDSSDMWLWRQLKYDPEFPRPLVINGRRYWWLSHLCAYERAKAGKAEAA
jgi:predicted DNA-binding transcriptional regulator AlpA